MYNNKTVALALGGGGTCGLAHIGVLKALEEHGIIPDYICGTSMGSIIGGFYACGLSVEDMIKECEKLKFFKLFDINPKIFTSNHLVPGKFTEKYLKRTTQEKTFEDAKIKFSCMAVDLIKGEEYEFTSGPIWQGIRASISIPVVFKPVEIDGMLLVDGGVLNNVPFKQLEKYKPDIIIASDVVNNYIYYGYPKHWWEVMELSFNLTQHSNEQTKLKRVKYKITPYIEEVSPFKPTMKYTKVLIEKGYLSALKTIKKIKKDFSNK